MCEAQKYGCPIEDKGITLRASHLIDQKVMNDPPARWEALRLVQAFQFTVSDINYTFIGWMMLTCCGLVRLGH